MEERPLTPRSRTRIFYNNTQLKHEVEFSFSSVGKSLEYAKFTGLFENVRQSQRGLISPDKISGRGKYILIFVRHFTVKCTLRIQNVRKGLEVHWTKCLARPK